MIAPGFVALALALPWLTLLPLQGVAAVLAHAITLVAACHGAGRVVAWLGKQPDAAPLLVIQWGVATLIGLSGVLIAAGAGTRTAHVALVFGCVAVHTGILGARFAHHARRFRLGLAGPRTWVVPAALLAVLGTLVVLGAAGEPLVRPFDDEGHVLGQLRRVLDTGALADPIGYPRRAGLGAQIALAAVTSGAGDGDARTLEAIGLVLALGLAMARIGARDASSALWTAILIVAAFALALAPLDPLPVWIPTGLLVALYAMLSDAEPPPLPLGLTAGALIALRHELAPAAVVAVIAAWWPRRTDHRRTAILAAGAVAVVLPFVIARVVAWGSVPSSAHAVIAGPAQSPLALRVLLAAAIAAPAACVLQLALPASLPLRRAGTATAVALGAIVAHLTGTGAYSLRLAWPIAIAFAITLVIELARSRWSGPSALIASLALCLFLYEGREAPGRLRWSQRMATAAAAIEELQHPPGDRGDPYASLLASVPAGATIAVWVSEPERLDYARHRIIDLRTPAGARLRAHRGERHAAKLAPLLAQVSAAFLLIEEDDAHVQPTQAALLYRLICQAARPMCADDLEAIAQSHPIAGRRDNLQLVDLRR